MLFYLNSSAQRVYSDSQLYARDFITKVIRDSIYLIFSKDTVSFNKIYEFENYLNKNKPKITALKSYLIIESYPSANLETVKSIRDLFDKNHWLYMIFAGIEPHPKRPSRK